MAWYERPHDPQQQRGFDLIGAMVRRRRVALGWTQRYLEARSGIDQAVISRLENGKQSGLRWSRFAELIEALDGLDVAAVTRPWPAGTAPLPNAVGRVPTPIQGIDLATGLDPSDDEQSAARWSSPEGLE